MIKKTNKAFLLRFACNLLGKYSNREQALNNPRLFANINIYFRRVFNQNVKSIEYSRMYNKQGCKMNVQISEILNILIHQLIQMYQ